MAANDRYIAMGKETTFGTIVPQTKFMEVLDADIEHPPLESREHLELRSDIHTRLANNTEHVDLTE